MITHDLFCLIFLFRVMSLENLIIEKKMKNETKSWSDPDPVEKLRIRQKSPVWIGHPGTYYVHLIYVAAFSYLLQSYMCSFIRYILVPGTPHICND